MHTKSLLQFCFLQIDSLDLDLELSIHYVQTKKVILFMICLFSPFNRITNQEYHWEDGGVKNCRRRLIILNSGNMLPTTEEIHTLYVHGRQEAVHKRRRKLRGGRGKKLPTSFMDGSKPMIHKALHIINLCDTKNIYWFSRKFSPCTSILSCTYNVF